MSRENVAVVVALGFVLGTFPAPGLPSVLCLAAALALRLDVAAFQVINQLATPAQFALAIPFSRLGSALIGRSSGLGGALASALLGWLCVGVPAGVALYAAALWLLRRGSRPLVAPVEIPSMGAATS